MEPGVEAVRIAESGQVTPGDHQRFLHGILGPIDVAEDPVGEREEAVATNADQVGICLPVPLPCGLDEISVHRLLPRWRPAGAPSGHYGIKPPRGNSFLVNGQTSASPFADALRQQAGGPSIEYLLTGRLTLPNRRTVRPACDARA